MVNGVQLDNFEAGSPMYSAQLPQQLLCSVCLSDAGRRKAGRLDFVQSTGNDSALLDEFSPRHPSDIMNTVSQTTNGDAEMVYQKDAEICIPVHAINAVRWVE